MLAFFVNYLPTPLVLLTDSSGNQAVHIAPEAFKVASAEFPDQIEFWQNALPGKLKGQLASVCTSSSQRRIPLFNSAFSVFSFPVLRFSASMAKVLMSQLTQMLKLLAALRVWVHAKTRQ